MFCCMLKSTDTTRQNQQIQKSNQQTNTTTRIIDVDKVIPAATATRTIPSATATRTTPSATATRTTLSNQTSYPPILF